MQCMHGPSSPVSSIAYDPENYTILIGVSSDTLTTINDIINIADANDLSFLTIVNTNYTIGVDGLVIFGNIIM